MSRVSKKKLYLIERANKRVLGEPEMECPKATQDLELNTENRDKSIDAEHIKYGPMNLSDDKYWEDLAKHWKLLLMYQKNLNVVIVWPLIFHQEWMNVCLVLFRMKMVVWDIAGCTISNVIQLEPVGHGQLVGQ